MVESFLKWLRNPFSDSDTVKDVTIPVIEITVIAVLGAATGFLACQANSTNERIKMVTEQANDPKISWYFVGEGTPSSPYKIGIRNYGLRSIDGVYMSLRDTEAEPGVTVKPGVMMKPLQEWYLSFSSIAPCSWVEFNTEKDPATGMPRTFTSGFNPKEMEEFSVHFKDYKAINWEIPPGGGMKESAPWVKSGINASDVDEKASSVEPPVFGEVSACG